MIFRHKDGELRLYGAAGATNPIYLPIVFSDANLTFPLGRGMTEEQLIMDRMNFDSNSHYIEGGDEAVMDPVPMSVTCKFTDAVSGDYLRKWLSGVTSINSKTLINAKATSLVTMGATSVSTPAFADGTKMAYNVEVLWTGSNSYGWKIKEVFFEPREQTITEGEDGISISLNGLIYGPITTITAFTSGVSVER